MPSTAASGEGFTLNEKEFLLGAFMNYLKIPESPFKSSEITECHLRNVKYCNLMIVSENLTSLKYPQSTSSVGDDGDC